MTAVLSVVLKSKILACEASLLAAASIGDEEEMRKRLPVIEVLRDCFGGLVASHADSDRRGLAVVAIGVGHLRGEFGELGEKVRREGALDFAKGGADGAV